MHRCHPPPTPAGGRGSHPGSRWAAAAPGAAGADLNAGAPAAVGCAGSGGGGGGASGGRVDVLHRGAHVERGLLLQRGGGWRGRRDGHHRGARGEAHEDGQEAGHAGEDPGGAVLDVREGGGRGPAGGPALVPLLEADPEHDGRQAAHEAQGGQRAQQHPRGPRAPRGPALQHPHGDDHGREEERGRGDDHGRGRHDPPMTVGVRPQTPESDGALRRFARVPIAGPVREARGDGRDDRAEEAAGGGQRNRQRRSIQHLETQSGAHSTRDGTLPSPPPML